MEIVDKPFLYRRTPPFMRYILLIALLFLYAGCDTDKKRTISKGGESPDSLYTRYWEERAQLFPLEATASGARSSHMRR